VSGLGYPISSFADLDRAVYYARGGDAAAARAVRDVLTVYHNHQNEQVQMSTAATFPVSPEDIRAIQAVLDKHYPPKTSPEKTQVPEGVHLVTGKRVGDSARNAAADRLDEAMAHGVITQEEWDARGSAALRAQTQPELDILVSDLPEVKVAAAPSSFSFTGARDVPIAGMLLAISVALVFLFPALAPVITCITWIAILLTVCIFSWKVP
jgi:hypothetical protein